MLALAGKNALPPCAAFLKNFADAQRGRSAATSVAEQERIADSLWQSELVLIEGQGHEIYIDRAKECVAALRNFQEGFGS